MNSLPSELVLKILEYGSTTEDWSLSRTCYDLYTIIDNKIYSLFKKRFNKKLDEFKKENGCDSMDIIKTICSGDYIFTGDLVWFTLIGKNMSTMWSPYSTNGTIDVVFFDERDEDDRSIYESSRLDENFSKTFPSILVDFEFDYFQEYYENIIVFCKDVITNNNHHNLWMRLFPCNDIKKCINIRSTKQQHALVHLITINCPSSTHKKHCSVYQSMMNCI